MVADSAGTAGFSPRQSKPVMAPITFHVPKRHWIRASQSTVPAGTTHWQCCPVTDAMESKSAS